jgi:hypothetical protein
MANFTPVSAAIGGGPIGLSAALLMLLTCARALSHLSLVCVSLSRREFGCLVGDRRTTELRQRDARAALAANAAGIRLRTKTVVAEFAQSPGIGGRIRTTQKTKTTITSDI